MSKLSSSLVNSLFLATAFVSSASRAESELTYKQFLFQEVGNCSDITRLKFQKAVSVVTSSVAHTEDKLPILAGLKLSLFENQTFSAVYDEHFQPKEGPKKVLFEQLLSGTWKEAFPGQDRLSLFDQEGHLAAYALTTGMKIKDKLVLFVYLTENFFRPGARETEVGLTLNEEAKGPKGESPSEYCSASRP